MYVGDPIPYDMSKDTIEDVREFVLFSKEYID
jgi:hypothetical protein